MLCRSFFLAFHRTGKWKEHLYSNFICRFLDLKIRKVLGIRRLWHAYPSFDPAMALRCLLVQSFEDARGYE